MSMLYNQLLAGMFGRTDEELAARERAYGTPLSTVTEPQKPGTGFFPPASAPVQSPLAELDPQRARAIADQMAPAFDPQWGAAGNRPDGRRVSTPIGQPEIALRDKLREHAARMYNGQSGPLTADENAQYLSNATLPARQLEINLAAKQKMLQDRNWDNNQSLAGLEMRDPMLSRTPEQAAADFQGRTVASGNGVVSGRASLGSPLIRIPERVTPEAPLPRFISRTPDAGPHSPSGYDPADLSGQKVGMQSLPVNRDINGDRIIAQRKSPLGPVDPGTTVSGGQNIRISPQRYEAAQAVKAQRLADLNGQSGGINGGYGPNVNMLVNSPEYNNSPPMVKMHMIQNAMQLDTQLAGKQLDNQGNLGVANVHAGATLGGAKLHAEASKYGADAGKLASQYTADAGLAGHKYGSDATVAAAKATADSNLKGTQYTADQGRLSRRETAAQAHAYDAAKNIENITRDASAEANSLKLTGEAKRKFINDKVSAYKGSLPGPDGEPPVAAPPAPVTAVPDMLEQVRNIVSATPPGSPAGSHQNIQSIMDLIPDPSSMSPADKDALLASLTQHGITRDDIAKYSSATGEPTFGRKTMAMGYLYPPMMVPSLVASGKWLGRKLTESESDTKRRQMRSRKAGLLTR